MVKNSNRAMPSCEPIRAVFESRLSCRLVRPKRAASSMFKSRHNATSPEHLTFELILFSPVLLLMLLGFLLRGPASKFETFRTPLFDHWLPAVLFSILWIVLMSVLVSTWRRSSSRIICVSSGVLMTLYFFVLAALWTGHLSLIDCLRKKGTEQGAPASP